MQVRMVPLEDGITSCGFRKIAAYVAGLDAGTQARSVTTNRFRGIRNALFGGLGSGGGLDASSGDPKQAAIAAGISTGLGAIVPVIPFMITTGAVAIAAAAIVSLVAHFLVGAAKSLVTPALVVVGRPRDDARRRDRRRGDVRHRAGVSDLA